MGRFCHCIFPLSSVIESVKFLGSLSSGRGVVKVECVHCGASGEIDETKIPAGASLINCPRCKEKFPIPTTVEPPPPAETEEQPAKPLPPPPTPLPSAPTDNFDHNSTARCTVCNQPFPESEMVRFGASRVCAACKPGYVQMLAQGKPSPGAFRYAGFGIRFGAKFLDCLILGLAGFAINATSGVLAPSLAGTSPGLLLAASALVFILQTALAACYSGYFLSKHRATPGKMACGLNVVTPTGEDISFLRGVGRYFGELLSSAILCIGYLMILTDAEKRALHDRVCNTRVVYR
jgi:uncharacterized RDD family membrane protein YckC